ncbi:related to Acetyltransferase [Sporisorium reilianum SRZ2]|uniref:Related to Acetyltransferase n=1 Tax=Sporisorium reilianum (strain SRZ2) TaxID=999809 RepID=E6ZPG4_SPORE|nr:related to Acetyltransferase [Sporisorium reilianum SRZ2]
MATEADVEAICRICSSSWRCSYSKLLSIHLIEAIIAKYYTHDRIQSEIAPAMPHWSGYIVVDDKHGHVVAVGAGAMSSATAGELYVLYADPDRRGKGFGSAVLELLTNQQVAAGASEQWVSVQKGNTLGLPFYLARGFVQVEEKPSWDDILSQEGVRSWRMRRSIGSRRESGS